MGYLPEESIKQGFLSNIRVKSKKYFSIVKMPDLFVVLNTVIDSKIENEILLSKTIYLPLGRYISNDNLKRSNFTFEKFLRFYFILISAILKKTTKIFYRSDVYFKGSKKKKLQLLYKYDSLSRRTKRFYAKK